MVLQQSPLGARVRVITLEKMIPLGFGTYIGEALFGEINIRPQNRILLDTIEFVYEYECLWKLSPYAPALEPFQFRLKKETRLFAHGHGLQLIRTNTSVKKDSVVTINRFQMMVYDHRSQLAIAIRGKKDELYLLAAEVEFPHFGDIR